MTWRTRYYGFFYYYLLIFTHFRDPTPDDSLGTVWQPYTIKEGHYMDIGEVLTPGVDPDKEEIEFWNDIYKEYYPQNSF